MSQSSDAIYCVKFYNDAQVYEVYARHVYPSDMYGFIEIEELVFNERSQVVVDPSEERLKNEFANVKRSYIPMHSIIRIDEVKKVGAGKVKDAKGQSIVTTFPSPPSGSPSNTPRSES